MATIGNKRTSQLIQITSAEVMPDDLFYVVDTSAKESKKMSASQLVIYLNTSGSIYALHSITSDSASYILGSGVYGTVQSASTAQFTIYAVSSSWASSSISSSWTATSSYSLNGEIGESQTSSYLKYQGFSNGTASFALTSSRTINCLTSSFLQYTPGVSNGTASYSIRTQNVDRAIIADTASYFNATIGTVASASIADTAVLSEYSIYADSASYLVYSPNNGTASYAMKSAVSTMGIIDYGIFSAHTQSNVIASIDNINVNPSSEVEEDTLVEAVGSLLINYTSSVPINGTLTLVSRNRDTGVSTTLDAMPVYFHLSPVVGNWDTLASGSLKMPFVILGQASMDGRYQLYVTTSAGINMDSSRTTKFKVSSASDYVSVSSDMELKFFVSPTSSLLSFTSSVGGPWYDYLPGIYNTGSQNILVMNGDGVGIDTIKYIWELSNLRELIVNDNNNLLALEGMPNSLATMSCYSCSLERIYDLDNIPTMSYLKCNDNNLPRLPALPISLSYLDCSRNNISSLPSVLPGGLTHLYCSDNVIETLPASISASSMVVLMAESNSLTSIPIGFGFSPFTVTMSLAYNLGLTTIDASWPISMSYLDVSFCPVVSLFTMPDSASYVNVYSTSLSSTAIENICSRLVINNQNSGTLDIRGTGVPSVSAMADITTLSTTTTRHWTVYYDV